MNEMSCGRNVMGNKYVLGTVQEILVMWIFFSQLTSNVGNIAGMWKFL